MPGAYPMELRERVVTAFNNGEGTYEEIAELFDIGRATVDRWVSRDRHTGSCAPMASGGARHPLKLDDRGEALVRELLEQMPDSTRAELARAVEQELGIKISERTIGRALARMGCTRKRGLSGRSRRSGKTSSKLARSSSRP